MSETKQIEGKIETWSAEVREFGKNNRGSRGLKIGEDWHNLVGKIKELNEIDKIHKPGDHVKFTIKKNPRGYWDIDGDIVKVQISEDPKRDVMQEPPEPIKKNVDKDILLAVSFKGAVRLGEVRTPVGILGLTKEFYKGLKQVKLQLQEEGEW